MKILRSLLAFTATLSLASATQAAIIIDTTPANNRANMSTQAGQTFTTGTLGTDNLLDSITIITASLVGAGDPIGPFTLKLFTDTDGNFATWDPGTEVAASTNSASLPAGNQSVTFNFALDTLSDSTVYVMSFNNGTSDHAAFRAGITNAAGVVLTDGALFSSGTQPFAGTYDLSFQVNAVPEPATASLALLPLVTAAAFLRRRQLRTRICRSENLAPERV
jgi:hypothetical protein